MKAALAVSSLTLLNGLVASGQVRYILTDLGASLSQPTSARAINNASQVVVNVDTTLGGQPLRGYLYSGGTLVPLGTLGGIQTIGNALNNSGDVVGYSTYPNSLTQRHAIFHNGGATDLGGPGAPNVYSVATGINNHGQIAGFYFDALGNTPTGYLYDGGTFHSLGTIPDSAETSGINDAGAVVGGADTPGGEHAFLSTNGSMLDLGVLPGGSISHANAINNLRQIVGFGDNGTSRHGFLYQNGHMTDLGAFAGEDTFAQAINNAGQIVGYSISDPSMDHFSTRALIDDGSSFIDLNTLIDPAVGWELQTANGINDLGQIVGAGFDAQGIEHAFLLTPIPEPSAVAIFLLAGAVLHRTHRARSH